MKLLPIAVGLTFFGTVTTLSKKLLNVTHSTGLFGTYTFNHPFFQTTGVFLGECLCIVIYLLQTLYSQSPNPNPNTCSKHNLNLNSNHNLYPPLLHNSHNNYYINSQGPEPEPLDHNEENNNNQLNKKKVFVNQVIVLKSEEDEMIMNNDNYKEARPKALSQDQDENQSKQREEATETIQPHRITFYEMKHFLLPAFLDLTATTLQNIGLSNTYVSVYSMLKGSSIIFTGLLSYFVFGRRINGYKKFGIFLVFLGVALVGLASIFADPKHDSAPNPLMGGVLIILAQFVIGIHMVVQEKAIKKFNTPALLVPSYEGLFGLIMVLICLVIFYYLPHVKSLTNDQAGDHFENSLDALAQLGSNSISLAAFIIFTLSDGGYNFFGVSASRDINSTSRQVLNNLRNVIIWGFDIGLGWENFYFLQIIGFIFIFIGTATYCELISFLRE